MLVRCWGTTSNAENAQRCIQDAQVKWIRKIGLYPVGSVEAYDVVLARSLPLFFPAAALPVAAQNPEIPQI